MKNIIKLTQIILLSTSILFLGGCVSKNDLKKPVRDYLKTNYGFREDFQILAAENNFLVDDIYDTYLRIDKPYPAYPRLAFEGETHLVKIDSDDFYLEMFKGAYIEQHPDVIRETKQIIKKYGLVKYTQKFVIKDGEPAYMFPFDNIELNMIYSKDLLKDFKKSQKIDTNALLPTLKPSDPRRENYNSRYIGVVNFLFEFDMNKNKHPIPKAKDLIVDFQQSGVLTKGIYNIDMLVDDSNPKHSVGWEHNNVALFEVDENGKYTIIATPKYDDLDNSYFYGDYVAEK
ncbi:hypothetical protein [Bacillus sp. X1(2014)]|uniref:hypothetical protein n=1 Tax=Bacillus sp. X1(2014) TaxID=1565991 RepID=UPI0011A5A24A|nr:hypothetical protein [Bacillus sp. X1(2014)]